MEFFSRKLRVVFWVFFVGVISRLIPHPSNFTATQAIALFGNRWISSSWMTWSVLLIVQFSSDILLGFYRGIEFIYLSLVLTALCAAWVGPIQGYWRSFWWSFASCLLFFLLSNLGCWWKGELYSQDVAGLLSCYAAGVPFFINHLLGTVFYSLGLEKFLMGKQHGSCRFVSQRAVI